MNLSYDFFQGPSDVWTDEPTVYGIIIYSVIIPIVSFVGICGNLLSLIVLIRREFKASIYTYLTVLAATDFLNSVLMLISGLSRGVLWYSEMWPQYDALVCLPLAGTLSCISVIATVSVAYDRVVYLYKPTRFIQPKFCRRAVARRIMFVGIIVAIFFNIPYCFMFEWNEEGILVTTDFFESDYYYYHTWVKFSIFGILAALLLIFGNGYLIYSIKQAHKLQKKCRINWKKNRDQKFVTLTLVAIVFFFLIGEFPTNFASRKSAAIILFGGDIEEAAQSKSLEIWRQIGTLLNAMNISSNFIIYCVFCPLFQRSLKRMCICKCDKKQQIKTNNLQVNVFFVNGKRLEQKGSFNLPNEKLFDFIQLQDENKSGSS